MSLKISVEEKSEIERIILLMNLGLTNALNEGLISIEEAENFLFSPYTMEQLKELKVNKEIIRIINLGCELENVEHLIPDKLTDSIDEIKNQSIKLLKTLPKPNLPLKKWID
jgi:hypothetical protein